MVNIKHPLLSKQSGSPIHLKGYMNTVYLALFIHLYDLKSHTCLVCVFNTCLAEPGHIHIWWLSGRVLDSRSKGRGLEPHRRHCVVSLSKNINPSLVLVLSLYNRKIVNGT